MVAVSSKYEINEEAQGISNSEVVNRLSPTIRREAEDRIRGL